MLLEESSCQAHHDIWWHKAKPPEALKMLLLLRSQDVREELAEICQEREVESATHGTWREFLSGEKKAAGHRHQHPTPSAALWNECLHVRRSLDF